ncbi:prolipoprotein diacylglyceryl transferase [Arsenicicoccus bolidensis]|uniref:Phosphatidylglycerol--prolipoprotein diacylglyceryl transferase n=1 Tax=Arsenicicoccus bolidensis TaxID=229480 RepID=A0ABS9Q3L1_9MICO|nr:prolipoprotein diacylglyceryl transferase [Arsenicicoccus bolidensis]MCG7321673.1 prolipoprotein diacylglyceryl transferase [Arsenicicoccus bolidensis]
MVLPTEIPSPTQGVWYLGPVPLRAYALCILAGILVAVWLTQRRLAARGGDPERVIDVAMWAVPFGIVGGRLYHVISSPQAYFGEGGHPVDALKIWNGGLGIWGAVALGALGAWIGCRRSGVSYLDFADALAPGLIIAQAIGRWGNWFNNELYGGPTDLPWALQIHEWDATTGKAVRDAGGQAVVLGSYHPTFLYESLWCLGVAALLVWADRRFRLRPGQVFALYVMGYTLGRVWIEMMRVDQANHVLGLRLNVWTSLLVFAFGLAWFVLARRQSRSVSTADPMESHTSE